MIMKEEACLQGMKKSIIAHQIIHLLKKSHSPRVAIGDSTIHAKAGRGVFSKQSISTKDLPMVMCLYPGIYTPGLPIHTLGATSSAASCTFVYLANKSPPSNYGTDINDNAYIMNLSCGGYIDGCALDSQIRRGGEKNNDGLDSNPSACGHLINHHSVGNNVEVHSFAWDDILLDDEGYDATTTTDEHFTIPNELRADGSPWYYDATIDKLVSFPTSSKGGIQKKIPPPLLCGAALVLTKPVSRGDELLLDYGLSEPYPPWAKGWYK